MENCVFLRGFFVFVVNFVKFAFDSMTFVNKSLNLVTLNIYQNEKTLHYDDFIALLDGGDCECADVARRRL